MAVQQWADSKPVTVLHTNCFPTVSGTMYRLWKKATDAGVPSVAPDGKAGSAPRQAGAPLPQVSVFAAGVAKVKRNRRSSTAITGTLLPCPASIDAYQMLFRGVDKADAVRVVTALICD